MDSSMFQNGNKIPIHTIFYNQQTQIFHVVITRKHNHFTLLNIYNNTFR